MSSQYFLYSEKLKEIIGKDKWIQTNSITDSGEEAAPVVLEQLGARALRILRKLEALIAFLLYKSEATALSEMAFKTLFVFGPGYFISCFPLS